MQFHPTDIAHGGEAVARVYGKAHFVAGAMPGEIVEGRVVRDKGSWARVEMTRVLEPSPDRVAPPCPHFEECGGCQWQYAAYPAQKRWKESIVAGQLRHLGGIEDPLVRPTVAAGAPFGYRNRMDFTVERGRLSLRRRRSRSTVPIDQCLLMEPGLAAVFERIGDATGARLVTLRIGVATGETLAVVRGSLPAGYEGWGCGVALAGDQLEPVIGPGTIHEEVAGTQFRITGDSFFQSSTPGAAALVALVTEALEPGPDDTLLDGYAGGGLFGLTAGRRAGQLIAVEESLPGVVDLNANARAAGIEPHVFNLDFAAAASEIRRPWDLAVVDPPRKGLGADGVTALTGPAPRSIAYVSCDPASLARDARWLTEAGYHLDWAAPVDQFPQTFHVETVAAFRKS